jgi:hypothetical protein
MAQHRDRWLYRLPGCGPREQAHGGTLGDAWAHATAGAYDLIRPATEDGLREALGKWKDVHWQFEPGGVVAIEHPGHPPELIADIFSAAARFRLEPLASSASM